MTRKEQSLLMWILFIIIIAVIASACGPAYHLGRAKHHWNKAIEKGATTTVETTWHTIPVITTAIRVSTTIRPDWTKLEIKRPTFTAHDEKTGAKTDVEVILRPDCPPECIDTFRIDTTVPPQKQEKKVPTAVHMEAKAGHTNGDMIVLAIACLGAGAVIGRLFWK